MMSPTPVTAIQLASNENKSVQINTQAINTVYHSFKRTGAHPALFSIVKVLSTAQARIRVCQCLLPYSLTLSPTLDPTSLNPKLSNRRKISIMVWNTKHYSLISTLQLVSSFAFGVTISGTLYGHICTNVQPHTPRCHHYPAYRA
jgi:hypothetical protein